MRKSRVVVVMLWGVALVAAGLATLPAAEHATHAQPRPPSRDAGVPRAEPTYGTLVAVGPAGELGTWRVLLRAPVGNDTAAQSALMSPCERSATGCASPPVFVASDRAQMDLGALAVDDTALVYLGARLITTTASRVYLSLGATGRASVLLDGRTLVAHAATELSADDSIALLDLSPGAHALVLRFERPSTTVAWRATVRLLDQDFAPGVGAASLEIGSLDEPTARSLSERAARVQDVRAVGASGLVVRARVSFPAGAVARPVGVDVIGGGSIAPRAGVIADALEREVTAAGGADVRVETRVVAIGRDVEADAAVAAQVVALRAAAASVPEASRAPVAWRLAELERIVSEGEPDTRWRRAMLADCARVTRELGAGRDPFAAPRGYVRMAFFSHLDDTVQPYELFVPPAYRATSPRTWPLLVTLHGFKGNAGDYFRNTFGLSRPSTQTLEEHGRDGVAPTQGPMIVIAPTGRGQTHYRFAGETDVLEAIADARARFHVDPRRIYVTGGSMGGTGAGYLPFRHPDLFAASAALAGYHDQRVRSDTNHLALSAWERFAEAERSDVDWAENALYLPMLLVRGTRDRPTEWTSRLVDRLTALHYRFEHREPESGHNVWTETYADGAIFQWLGRYRLPVAPRRVVLRTARERQAAAYWVAVDERARPDAFAQVDARMERTGRVTVQTDGVARLTLSPPESIAPAATPLRVLIDGTALEGACPMHLVRASASASWEIADGAQPAGRKHAGASGPIRDPFTDPLMFVVGTRDRHHTFVNRMVAEQWARPHGWDVSFPIVDDVDVTDDMLRTHSVVLVGPPHSNAVLARVIATLPIRVDDRAVLVGATEYEGEQVGTVFVAQSPWSPDRSVVVIAGPQPLGTWRSTFLPDLLPDYVVFDEHVAPARDRFAAGGTGATLRAAGYFGMDWRP